MDLILAQKQTQKMSPQIIQFMSILQMGMLELHEYVEEQLLENPVLDREETYMQEEGTMLLLRLEWLSITGRRVPASQQSEVGDFLEVLADAPKESLYEHLKAQVSWRALSPVLCRGVETVLTGLNDNGWLEETAEEMAQRGGVDTEIITKAEALVQELEPSGVGARTLSQCLELQLRRMGEEGLALTIVKNHLEDMAKDHYNKIVQATHETKEAVYRACQRIRALNPRPGAAFAHTGLPSFITPDILVGEENGRHIVRLAGENIPDLKINEYYQRMLCESTDESVKKYLKQKFQQADWVLKSIEQRKETVLRCVRCIVEHQEEFFRQGKRFLRPLTVSDVAAEVKMSESTVSRAIRNKYLQCTWGVFSLSDFISRAHDCGGEELSTAQAKEKLRALIEGEDKRKPLSDQKLCDRLAAQGIVLARRTVAKYREAIGFPAAPGRKQF